jgi:hypothetical protein
MSCLHVCRQFWSEEADMAESAAEALASLSVMATQHASAERRPSDYAPDGHPGMVGLLLYIVESSGRLFFRVFWSIAFERFVLFTRSLRILSRLLRVLPVDTKHEGHKMRV